jgi:hypothetical protein
VEAIKRVFDTLNPEQGALAERRAQFRQFATQFAEAADPVKADMSRIMQSFEGGLFVGSDDCELPGDNLDLERWFREPKGHERRIHGHRHAGVRIVQEGPTLTLTLDAHRHRPHPFSESELSPYRHAAIPACQREAVHRRKIMRKARSKQKRPLLLEELETRYLDSS